MQEMKESNETKVENDLNEILSYVFYKNESNSKYIPIIKLPIEINQLKTFFSDESIELKQKIFILEQLMELLLKNTSLIHYINSYKKEWLLFKIGIDLYLNEQNSEEDDAKILNFINLIRINTSINQKILEIIYQKLSKFYRNEEKYTLTSKLLLKYLKLLKLLYQEQQIKDIRDYVYLNGVESQIKVEINPNKKRDIRYGNFDYGMTIVFWIKINEETFREFNNILNYKNANLVNIELDKLHTIKISLIEEFHLKISGIDIEANIIDIKNVFDYTKWNFFFIIIKKNKSKENKNCIINLNNNEIFKGGIGNTTKKEITNMTFIENIPCKITSLLIFNSSLKKTSNIKYFTQFPYGIYNNTILYQIIRSKHEKYLKCCDDLYENIPNNINKYELEFNFSLSSKQEDNVIIFSPFLYDSTNNIIDDACGNFIGYLKEGGVNIYTLNGLNIKTLGGINNILPIAELMLLSKKKILTHQISNDLLNEDTLYKYLILIKTIIINNNNNLQDANENNFFSSLGMFIEKFPKEIFTQRVFDILREIGNFAFNKQSNQNNFNRYILLNEKIIFKFPKQIQLLLLKTIYNFTEIDYIQIKNILTIPKMCLILRKIDENRYNQFCCREHAELFIPKSDKPISENDDKIMQPETNTQIDGFCLIILKIFCQNPEPNNCNLFKLLSMDLSPCLQKSIINIFITFFLDINIPLEKHIELVSYFLKKDCLDVALYVLSTSLLDVRSAIVNLLGILFNNYEDVIKSEIREINLRLRRSNALYERRNEKLKIISEKKILWFILNNLFPNNLLLEVKDDEGNNINNNNTLNKDNKREKTPQNKKSNSISINENFPLKKRAYSTKILFRKKKKVPLLNVVNMIKFNIQIDQMWQSLKVMLLFKKDISVYSEIDNNKPESKSQYSKEKKEISFNPQAIDFFIKFCQHKPSKYVNRFINQLIGIIQDPNNNCIFKDDNLYNWVIETIYYFDPDLKFYESEKDINLFTITDINENIKTIIMGFFDYFPDNDYSENYIERLREILIFTLYLKKSLLNSPEYKAKPEKQKEKINNILNVTRKLFLMSLRNNNCTDLKTKVIFDFMVIFNNADLYSDKNYLAFNKTKDSFTTPYISDIIISSLSLYEDEVNKNDEKEKNLSQIWKDFDLFETIIKKYSNNWQLNSICKKFAIEYSDGVSYEKNAPQLIKEVGFNRKKKNILLEFLNAFIYKYIVNPFNSIPNIIQITHNPISLINVIDLLIKIAIDITKNDIERNKWVNEYYKFIIFCILCSINILSTEKNYESIQNVLSDVIGMGFKFLQLKNKLLADSIINNFVFHILKEQKERKSILFSINTLKSKSFKCAVNSIFTFESQNTEVVNNTIYKKNIILKEDSIKSKFINLESYRYTYCELSNKIILKIIPKYTFYYNNNNKLIENIEDDLKNEYNRIEKSISNVIHLFDNQINQYLNNTNLEDKIIKHKYKKIKQCLFSWNGLWSDRKLFYDNPHSLKLRNKNHYTSEMIRPLLVPILDVNYYLPKFPRSKKQLFSSKSIYTINLNIDDILNIEEHEEQSQCKNKCFIRELGFNYLQSLYKLTYPSLWEFYKKNITQKLKFDRSFYNSKDNLIELIKIKRTDENKNINNIIIKNCCMVKQTHHIKGLIVLEEERLLFYAFEIEGVKNTREKEEDKDDNESDKEENADENANAKESESDEMTKEDDHFDSDRKMCYGSYFLHFKKDKDKCYFNLPYTDIKYIFYRNYYYQNNSIEIFTNTHKSYFFTFNTINDCEEIKTNFTQYIQPSIFIKIGKIEKIGLMKTENSFRRTGTFFKKTFTISTKEEEWIKYQISTLEYLMWLNIFGNRSFNDLAQYPIFPWIFTDYSSEQDPTLRPLYLPMGMLDINEKSKERKKVFTEIYESMLSEHINQTHEGNECIAEINPFELNQVPYFYGSHYSNPTYVTHFLIRILPYSLISLEIQGDKFEEPDRIFHSIEKSFQSSSTQKTDIRELSPEFFYLPEMFMNINKLNLIEDEKIDTYGNFDNVIMPKWCNGNPFNFIEKMRICLEDDKINVSNINITEDKETGKNENLISKWINLIFGVHQRGKNAEKHKNVYMATTYGINLNEVKTKEDKAAIMRLVEMGMTPYQVLFEKAKNKDHMLSPLYNKEGNLLCNCNKLTVDMHIIKSDICTNKNTLNITKLKSISNDKMLLICNKNKYFIVKIIPKEQNSIVFYQDCKILELYSDSIEYLVNYNMSYITEPIEIYANKQKVIRGGFWDGRFEVITLEIQSKLPREYYVCYHPRERSPIVTIAINKSENFLFCGTKSGIVYFYQLNTAKPFLNKTIYDIQSEIISICINDTLNLVAFCSIDGDIYIYTLPLIEKVRVIKIRQKNAHQIFLSSSPLPCIVVFADKEFISYSINGMYISKEWEIEQITCNMLFKSNTFEDLIIYGTNNGQIKIRTFPNMLLKAEVNVSDGPVRAMEISKDKKNLFVWGEGNKDNIAIVRDLSVIREKSSKQIRNMISIY